MKIICVILTAALLTGAYAQAQDLRTVIGVPRHRIETADYRAKGHLVQVDANGKRISYSINLKARWFPGVLRTLIEIAPSQGADTKTRQNGRIRILLEVRPDGRNAIQIVHQGDAAMTSLPIEKWSESLFGSNFSYEDFLEAQYYWRGQAILKRARFGARDCDVLKSTPDPSDRTRYAEVQTWLDHTIGYPVYAQKILKGSGIEKDFTYFGLRQTGGVWSASQVEVKMQGHAGSTFLIVDSGSAKANLSLKDFSPEQISHFEDRP